MNITNITFSILEKIEKANKDFDLFNGGDKILVGLSGGADSVSLLLALNTLSEKYRFSLYALHVNHMIRDAEADRDEEFARSLCEKNGIEFFCERVDVPSFCKKSGESLELCARNVRYKAFENVCKTHGITLVATAHNACDNAETVLFNLVRGSGIRGLCGIPAKRSLCKGVKVIRPLIYAERCEIEEYLGFMGQNFVTDSTNTDTDYTRNFIRSRVIPMLKKINPALEQSISRTAKLHRQDEEYLCLTAKQYMTNDLHELSTLHESILSRVVINLFEEVSDETLSEFHVNRLCESIYSYDGKDTSLSFPDGMSAKLVNGKLEFIKDGGKSIKINDFEIPLCKGEMIFEENPYALYISFDQNEDIPKTLKNKENIYKKYTTDYLYFDTIPSVLSVRNRHNGDKIYASGMNKSIKRLMLNSDYCADERYFVPFVCEGDKILLVPGVCTCDDCKMSDRKKEKISVSLYKKI